MVKSKGTKFNNWRRSYPSTFWKMFTNFTLRILSLSRIIWTLSEIPIFMSCSTLHVFSFLKNKYLQIPTWQETSSNWFSFSFMKQNQASCTRSSRIIKSHTGTWLMDWFDSIAILQLLVLPINFILNLSIDSTWIKSLLHCGHIRFTDKISQNIFIYLYLRNSLTWSWQIQLTALTKLMKTTPNTNNWKRRNSKDNSPNRTRRMKNNWPL